MARKKISDTSSARVDMFLRYLKQYFEAAGIVVKEYKFHEVRKWRFDYAFPDVKVASEVDGAVWTQGRHTRGAGYLGDMEKLNTAASMGWLVLRITPDDRFLLSTRTLIADTINTRLL